MTAPVVNRDVRVAEGADGGLVILGAWCSTCCEEVGPNRDGVCPWCGSRIVDEDTLPARDLVAQAKAGLTPAPDQSGGTMTATAVRTCKRDGCDYPVLDKAGPYGGLCATHKDEAKQSRPPRARSTAPGGGFVGC